MEMVNILIFKRIKVCFCVVAIFSYCLPVNAQNKSPSIIDFYPQCDYKIIDTVDAKQRINNELSQLDEFQYKKAFAEIVSKLKQKASEAKADQIALLKKTSTKTFNKHYLVFTAELIRTCRKDSAFPKKLAKLDTSGKPQIALSTTVLEIENKLVINMPAVDKRLEPQLITTNIEIAGAYGVKLGDNLQDVIETLGTPTVEINTSEQSHMLMYGRHHMFEFLNDKLHSVSGHNPHFSSDLKNLLEFDDRFDDVKWQVDNEYQKNQELTQQQSQSLNGKSILIKNDKALLQVQTEKRSGFGSKPPSYTAETFRLSEQPYLTTEEIKAASSLPILSFISERLAREKPLILFSEIPFSYTMKAWVGPAKRMYTYGQHIAIETIGDRVTTIHLLENLYIETSPFYNKETWQVGLYKQGMTAKSAQLIAGDDGSYFNEELEIMQDGLTHKLYFYEQKRQVKLYAGEINFY